MPKKKSNRIIIGIIAICLSLPQCMEACISMLERKIVRPRGSQRKFKGIHGANAKSSLLIRLKKELMP